MTKTHPSPAQIRKIVRNAQRMMAGHDDAAKERRRVDKIFNTVYRYARSHGQSHRRALKYCLNVFKDQAPSWSYKIVIQAINAEAPMKINRTDLRRFISEALIEAGVIKYTTRPTMSRMSGAGGEVITPTFGLPKETQGSSSFIDALRDLKSEIEDLTVTLTNLTPAQKSYLDSMIDMLSDGIADEEIVNGDLGVEDVEEDEDEYLEDERGVADFLKAMGMRARGRSVGSAALSDPDFDSPTDDVD